MASDRQPAAGFDPRGAVRDHTIVIGAGPAGLAVGACLKCAGVSCSILEQGADVGTMWRQHYDRLRLNTDKARSSLPFLPFPRSYPRYPSRQQVIDYLENYSRSFQLDPKFRQQVVSACRADGFWRLETRDSRYEARNLVVCAGFNREPHVPAWPDQRAFEGQVLHSSLYRSGKAFAKQRVLVVGFGNSGGEIAVDLCEHGAETCLAVRSPVNVIPRELFGIPILALAIAESKLPARAIDALNGPLLRLIFGDLTRYGLGRPALGPAAMIEQEARLPVIDVGTINLVKNGRVGVRPGVERFTSGGVVFTDGRHEKFDAVVLATGFRPRVNAFLKGADSVLDERGGPTTSGRQTSLPGLYFCGYHVTVTGMLREIALEARRIATAIAAAS